MHALRELGHFSASFNLEFRRTGTLGGVIHGFAKTNQGFHYLAGQDKAYPYAEEKRHSGYDAQGPFRRTHQPASLVMVALNAVPVFRLEFG